MRLLGFLASLLAHLLFLLLLVHLRFPMPEAGLMPQVIEIVPMAPPVAEAGAEAPPPLVYVRPFVLRGGAPAARAAAPSTPVDRRGAVPGAPSGRGEGRMPALPGREAVGEAAEPEREKAPRLTVDMGEISRRLGERKATVDGSSFAGAQGLPFGDPDAPGEGEFPGGEASAAGDGTASDAMAGNAFFDSRGYDITPWARRMVYRVKKNWISPPVSRYGLKGVVGIYVLIGRDGAIVRSFVRRASGIRPLDQAAFNAVALSAPLPPLPDDYPRADLAAYLLFYYN
ncbi:MAG: TonB C-terminal domain-containing protein [Candidatus Aminicenantes bacterium]|nr:TonB C-terminal domain-containing protein [Candidatus Aminicenantes bacterium]